MATDRKTVLIVDACGTEWWADVDDAERWHVPVVGGVETLYFTGGGWVLLPVDDLSVFLGQPPVARLISAKDALHWLVEHRQAVPKPLLGIAAAWRLPSSLSLKSRNTARRRKRRHSRARRAALGSQPGPGNDTADG